MDNPQLEDLLVNSGLAIERLSQACNIPLPEVDAALVLEMQGSLGPAIVTIAREKWGCTVALFAVARAFALQATHMRLAEDHGHAVLDEAHIERLCDFLRALLRVTKYLGETDPLQFEAEVRARFLDPDTSTRH